MFRAGEDIAAKIYAMKTPKDTYSLKLCRISMEGYARAERMITEGRREDIESIYAMLDGWVETSLCTKRDIVIGSGTSVAPFSVQDMYSDHTIDPGLYILAPRLQSDALSFNRIVLPRVFSVVDSQITMKVDASGKMSFLVTDINTWAPRSGQEIQLNKNILKTHTETWDTKSQQSIKTYLPFSNRSFSTGITLWDTATDGSLETYREALTPDEYSPPYGLMYEWYGDYEGQYQSFVATSAGDGHFGYVVSTWNDGITGWNFGLKDSDYSWETRGAYTSYLHTDRKLYLPGEKVYVHAIIRANDSALTIPSDQSFTLRVTDPIGTEIKAVVLRPNEFGTISTEFDLGKNTTLWSYIVQLSSTSDDTATVENGYTNFQVEVFKNPTFTASVKLSSPDIENDILLTLRKKENTDQSSPWYKDVYSSTFSIDGIVKASYYNGTQMRGVPFSYRIYRSAYYDSSYWTDCFWWCYWEPSPEFYTEGTGVIDHDGLGILHVPVEFSSFHDDYVYTAEVTIIDPATGESVVTPSTLLARLPQQYKAFDPYNPLIFTPETKILNSGDILSGTLSFAYGKWDPSLKNRYNYELIHREYSRTLIDDLRVRDTAITNSLDILILSGAITGTGLRVSTKWLSPGEYHLRVSPIVDGHGTPPETSRADTLFYIAGDFVDANSTLRVIPEKTIYHSWETARVLITTPFTGWYLYITHERAWVLDHEYVQVTGNTLVREYKIDDTFYPNVYIWVVAYAPHYRADHRNYAVWYGEIVTDLTDKKANLTLTPDKDTYKNRETVNLSLHLTDRTGTPLSGEVAVMVVDESLIRLMGNIDLDVVAKFFRKSPFTMKTALSAIGMERNRFLSRKWANGWSGDKGGDGAAIASRILFRNTAYYNPSVRTDAKGDAKISFTLPDNITDYRIITIGQTKDSQFAVTEKTIQVRKDYTIETHVPYIAYPGDTFHAITTVANATKKITNANVEVTFGTGADAFVDTKSVIIQAFSTTAVDVVVPVGKNWREDTPYTISVIEKEIPLDSVTRTLRIAEIPLIEAVSRQSGVLTGAQMTLDLTPLTRSIDPKKSHITLTTSRGLLRDPTSTIASLITYPYGCIEQTIASTLPNAIALRFATVLGLDIDKNQAQQNLDDGVAKILRMQLWGGWKYWQDDATANPHVTPYVVRSLYALRDMWVLIPQSAIDSGLQYIVDMVDYQGDSLDGDAFAEVFVTLAQARHPRASWLVPHLEKLRKSASPVISWTSSIDTKTLSRHGLLMYAYGLQYLGKIPDELLWELARVMAQKDPTTYWYWDASADQAIYARLLLERWDLSASTLLLDQLTRDIDLRSYYISTQSKIQLFIALTRHAELTQTKGDIPMLLRSDGLIAKLDLIGKAYSRTIDVARDTVSDKLVFTRERWWVPLFYEILQYDTPSDILQTKSTSAYGMEVSRQFERVDESRGIDSDGKWIVTTPVTDAVFQKWQLYRVTLTATPPVSDTPSYYLTLEDFVPGWWRPIRWVFTTESRSTTDTNQEGWYWNGWSHVEARDDRILATADSLWSSEPQTYTYYIRPEYAGTYLLPPVTAYYMYRPEVHAIGRYERVEVRE
jgi:alpha-2-macroglobulin